MAGGLCASASLAQQRPHIILIVTDQQRADALGVYGQFRCHFTEYRSFGP